MVLLRPMSYDDVPPVERLTATVFHGLDLANRRPGEPEPRLRPPERAGPWIDRMRHLVALDSPGCWVAEEDERVVGCVAALVRDGLWGLASFAVHPDWQGRGLGKQLLEVALAHGPWSAGIICSSSYPAAVHRYRAAGFEMVPAMACSGLVRRDAIAATPGLRTGGADDIELLDTIDRAARGFGHGADHEVIVAQLPLIVFERGGSRGYAYQFANGSPYLVAATDDSAARAVLWGALARATPDEPVQFSNVTTDQEWAVDVARSAGLDVRPYGYVAVQGMSVPAPYIPCGHFL
jgi:N-acetylglutamate synthase-like GNAT family acetyltransferase